MTTTIFKIVVSYWTLFTIAFFLFFANNGPYVTIDYCSPRPKDPGLIGSLNTNLFSGWSDWFPVPVLKDGLHEKCPAEELDQNEPEIELENVPETVPPPSPPSLDIEGVEEEAAALIVVPLLEDLLDTVLNVSTSTDSDQEEQRLMVQKQYEHLKEVFREQDIWGKKKVTSLQEEEDVQQNLKDLKNSPENARNEVINVTAVTLEEVFREEDIWSKKKATSVQKEDVLEKLENLQNLKNSSGNAWNEVINVTVVTPEGHKELESAPECQSNVTKDGDEIPKNGTDFVEIFFKTFPKDVEIQAKKKDESTSEVFEIEMIQKSGANDRVKNETSKPREVCEVLSNPF